MGRRHFPTYMHEILVLWRVSSFFGELICVFATFVVKNYVLNRAQYLRNHSFSNCACMALRTVQFVTKLA